jgi:hypothetical protein
MELRQSKGLRQLLHVVGCRRGRSSRTSLDDGAPIAAPIAGDEAVAGARERGDLVFPDLAAAGRGVQGDDRVALAARVDAPEPQTWQLNVALRDGFADWLRLHPSERNCRQYDREG